MNKLLLGLMCSLLLVVGVSSQRKPSFVYHGNGVGTYGSNLMMFLAGKANPNVSGGLEWGTSFMLFFYNYHYTAGQAIQATMFVSPSSSKVPLSYYGIQNQIHPSSKIYLMVVPVPELAFTQQVTWMGMLGWNFPAAPPAWDSVHLYFQVAITYANGDMALTNMLDVTF